MTDYFFWIINCANLKKIFNFNLKEAKSQHGKNIVLIDGVRTPFLPSYTEFKDIMAYELGRNALL